MRPGKLNPTCCVAAILALLLGGCSDSQPDSSQARQSAPTAGVDVLAEARAALAAKQYDRALQQAASVPAGSPDWKAAQLVTGEAAMKAGRLDQARVAFQSLAEQSEDPRTAAEGWFYVGETSRELGELSRAEAAYHQVLATEPGNAATHARLAFLLSTTGQRWKALPHYWELVKSGSATLNELILFADIDRPVERREYLQECAEKAPMDRHVQLGLAAHDFWDGKAEEAEQRLRQVLKAEPGLIDGQALLGELLVDQGAEAFGQWHRSLPAEADDHPDIWYVRGLWARRADQLRIAAKCFWQAARLAPTHRRAFYQLGQVLVALNEKGGDAFGQRAARLIALTQQLDQVLRSNGQREAPMREATLELERMGRIWEACAWGVLARRQFPRADWPRELLARRAPLLSDDLPLTLDEANLALQFDLSGFPDFRDVLTPSEIPSTQLTGGEAPSTIRFSDKPGGLEFVYFNSDDPSTRGVRMFEVNGGGVAAFDMDGDGAADLYFTQGAEWKHGDAAATESAAYTDGLFRLTSGMYENVTANAFPGGTANTGYGQGCSAVDYDDDGFADLYVANVGGNRLYRNNGDGTFSDVSEQAGLHRQQWTASCVGVDLNDDGLPDLYDVNYLEGEGIFEALCDGRACSPTNFSGARDRLLINRGDGTFEEAAEATPPEGGKGLGVVAVPLNPRRPSLFIANDQVANFLLRNEPSDNRTNVSLINAGFQSGLAFNENGLPMACMGIAADDCDGNGQIDFFVTNFSDESNTLYLQDAPGLFIDATKPSELQASSYPFVGWGTQFLDADRDGLSDLVLTNGNVDDYTDEGKDYHMRPQFFWNRGEGRFVELFADQLGPYFAHKYLGRGMARLDWNRDGLMDFVVSNIGTPAKLVTNQTRSPGNFLSLKLHATQTARDAVGTSVTVQTDSGSWTKMLLAGDGFQASNERLLQFGLGRAAGVKSVVVRWPSGSVTRMADVPLNRTYELVEGRTAALQWQGSRAESFRVQPDSATREP